MTAPLEGDTILPILITNSCQQLPLLAAPCLFPADSHQHALQGDWSVSEVACALKGLPHHMLHTCTVLTGHSQQAAMPSGSARDVQGQRPAFLQPGPLTCRQAAAGTHGATRFRAGLGDGWNTD